MAEDKPIDPNQNPEKEKHEADFEADIKGSKDGIFGTRPSKLRTSLTNCKNIRRWPKRILTLPKSKHWNPT
jgi:hypothetical protein